jgi:RNA polymerase sigma-70 factor (ECF subfamily)
MCRGRRPRRPVKFDDILYLWVLILRDDEGVVPYIFVQKIFEIYLTKLKNLRLYIYLRRKNIFAGSGGNKIDDINIHEVLKKAAAGDKASFDILVERFNKNMIITAKIYAGSEAEDIVQTVWVKLYERREILLNVENIENWLFYAVKHHCIDFLRKNKKAKNISLEINQGYIDSLVHDDDILEIILKRRSKDELHAKIEELGEIYYMPIILHYFEDLKLKEISEILGVSVSTLKGRLYIGRQLLKKVLARDNILN